MNRFAGGRILFAPSRFTLPHCSWKPQNLANHIAAFGSGRRNQRGRRQEDLLTRNGINCSRMQNCILLPGFLPLFIGLRLLSGWALAGLDGKYPIGANLLPEIAASIG